MLRSRLFLVASVLAVGSAGCAICDTCDEMPVPCSGPGCNATLRTVGSPMMPLPAGSFSAEAVLPIAPPASASETSPALSLKAPALPEIPAEPTTPPPPPPAPVKP